MTALAERLGPHAFAVAADATDAADLDRLVADVGAAHGRIDLLVHAGGLVVTTPFPDRDDTSIEGELALDLTAPLLLTAGLCRSCAPGHLDGRLRAQS